MGHNVFFRHRKQQITGGIHVTTVFYGEYSPPCQTTLF
jgi:hypothetical protein